MILTPSDPDIQTIAERIRREDLDLQPDFQRGEVWSIEKKKRLIDSILREWHVPPIHTVVVEETGQQQVLDGQQRLAAIRDFVNGQFSINGSIPPDDARIRSLDGKLYTQLPPNERRRFDAFTIRIIRITDYSPEEPGELFFRLNQITNITAAEQRNAFFGPARHQVKKAVEEFERLGNNQSSLGFSNSRMAYDDVVGKFLCTLEAGTLNVKLTASTMSDRFRRKIEFAPVAVKRAHCALKAFSDMRARAQGPLSFNKATLLSWLIFVAHFSEHQLTCHDCLSLLGDFLKWFEQLRKQQKPITSGYFGMSPQIVSRLIEIFNDRSTSRVLDVASVTYRDVVLVALHDTACTDYCECRPTFDEEKSRQLRELLGSLQLGGADVEHSLETFISSDVWGRINASR